MTKWPVCLIFSDLPDKDDVGVTDPYVEIFATEGLTGKEVKVGRTGTLTNTKNPSWGETFEFKWDRRKEQVSKNA